MTDTEIVWGEITEGALARLRERIGVPRKRSSMYPGGELHLTAETIRRFTNGVGDDNPLYASRTYGASTRWGAMLMNPLFVALMERANGATEGFPGCHAIWREADYTWLEPLCEGMVLDATTTLVDARLVDSEFSGRSGVQDHSTEVVGVTDGRTVARFTTSWHRFGRHRAEERRKLERKEQRELASYTPAELAQIREAYRSETRRGAEPLYASDVSAGDEVPAIVKGPTTTTSKLAFEFALGLPGWVVGHKLAMTLFDEHPGLAFTNEQGVPEPPVAIHWSNERSQRVLGLPGSYEAGYERLAWIGHHLSNWMGDDGFLRRLAVRFPTFSLLGDTTWCRARVTAVAGDIVTLDVRTENQRGDVTTTGIAEVVLPSRGP
jgi:acyl dehydratase